MGTWISRIEDPGDGLRLAVKDAIDLAGHVTTVGCRALAETSAPATADADCVRSARQAGARVVGKTNLHELCFGTTGENPWYGTAVNPAAPDRVPGGSSSGSAAAVGAGEADVALGTDTGGSVRLPAACCGVVGLKTTWGRISLRGVWPLAPSLDTVGPLARDVEGVIAGMGLLVPGFTAAAPARRVGRLRPPGVAPELDDAIDHALEVSGLDVVEVELEGWEPAAGAFATLIAVEAWRSNSQLLRDHGDRVREPVRSLLLLCEHADAALLDGARAGQEAWRSAVDRLLSEVDVLALPTLTGPPPALGTPGLDNSLVLPWNTSGDPAISLPVEVPGWPMPGSLQLVGPQQGEELLCGTAELIEAGALSDAGPG